MVSKCLPMDTMGFTVVWTEIEIPLFSAPLGPYPWIIIFTLPLNINIIQSNI